MVHLSASGLDCVYEQLKASDIGDRVSFPKDAISSGCRHLKAFLVSDRPFVLKVFSMYTFDTAYIQRAANENNKFIWDFAECKKHLNIGHWGIFERDRLITNNQPFN